jgi:hypothetical protein
VQDFKALVEDYIEKRYGAGAGAPRARVDVDAP